MTTKTRTRRAPRTPAAPAAPDVNATPAADTAPAAPARAMYGDVRMSAMLDTLCTAFPLLAAYRSRGADASRGAAAFYSAAFGTSASDVPALLDTAARLCAAVGANPSNIADAPAADTLDSLAAFYYANRARHPMSQNVSDADRRDVAARVSAALLASADRLSGRTAARTFSGRYGTRDHFAHVVHGIAHAVNTLRNPPPPSDD